MDVCTPCKKRLIPKTLLSKKLTIDQDISLDWWLDGSFMNSRMFLLPKVSHEFLISLIMEV